MSFSFNHYTNRHPFRTYAFLLLLMLLSGIGCKTAKAETTKLNACLENARTPLTKIECFRGLPYRPDGALDEYNRWTTWADQNQEFSSAGLNCSGLTTAIRIVIEGSPIHLNTARRDRLNDSGSSSTMGEDWDFGLDLILNLTDGQARKLIPDPYEGQSIDSNLWSAHDLRGINIDSSALPTMLTDLQSDKIYYFAISKSDSRFKGGISFYHVGVLIKDAANIWMYHATAKGGVYRVNLAGERGTAWLRKYYGANANGLRYIQLVEVEL